MQPTGGCGGAADLFSMMLRGMLPAGAARMGTSRSTIVVAKGPRSCGWDLIAISPATTR